MLHASSTIVEIHMSRKGENVYDGLLSLAFSLSLTIQYLQNNQYEGKTFQKDSTQSLMNQEGFSVWLVRTGTVPSPVRVPGLLILSGGYFPSLT